MITLTVKQLIEELQKYPEDMPVATLGDIDWYAKDQPNWIEVKRCVWTHCNYPYDKEDFAYVNLT